jgi:hypothetical protein
MRQKNYRFVYIFRYVRDVLQSDFNNKSKIYARIKLTQPPLLMWELINSIPMSPFLREIFSSEPFRVKRQRSQSVLF